MKRISQDLEKFIYEEDAWIVFTDNPEFRDEHEGSDESDQSDYDVNQDGERDLGSESSESEDFDNKEDANSPSQRGFDDEMPGYDESGSNERGAKTKSSEDSR